MEPFIVKHYSEDERPIIKSNGFDGLEVGEDREEAQEFIAFVNNQLAEHDKTILEQQARIADLRTLLSGEVKIALYYGQANINNSGCKEGSKMDETSKHLERVEELVCKELFNTDDLSALESVLASERLAGKIEGLEEAARKVDGLTISRYTLASELRRMAAGLKEGK